MSEIGEQLIQAVRDVAQENPKYVFEGYCAYVSSGVPACLIGHAAWKLGLIDADTEGAPVNDDGVEGLMNYLDLELESRELYWLETVQTNQDNEEPWGEAVTLADRQVVAR